MNIKLLMCLLIHLICIPTLNLDSEANDFGWKGDVSSQWE